MNLNLLESSDNVRMRVQAPFSVMGHSYTKPVLVVAEFVRVPFGAPTMMLERGRAERGYVGTTN